MSEDIYDTSFNRPTNVFQIYYITEVSILAGVLSFPSRLKINWKYNKFGLFPISFHFIASNIINLFDNLNLSILSFPLSRFFFSSNKTTRNLQSLAPLELVHSRFMLFLTSPFNPLIILLMGFMWEPY